MTIITSTGTVSLFNKKHSYEAYHLESEKVDLSSLENDPSMVVGNDYASVLITTNRERVDELKALITESDLVTQKNEFENNSVAVLNINDVYLIPLDHEYMNEEFYEFVEEHFAVFGAHADDIDIGSCVLGRGYMVEQGLSVDDVMELDAKEAAGSDDDDLEYAINSLGTIFEYSNTEQQIEVMKALDAFDRLYERMVESI